LGFPTVYVCVGVSWQSVSQPLLLLPSSSAPAPLPPQPHNFTTHIFHPPPHISLGSCHRLGLTGKRKHNQKDNVIMPQCGTIYTKMNTTKKKRRKSTFLASFPRPPTFSPLRSALGFGFSAFPCSFYFLQLLLLLLLFFFFLASKRDPLFLQLLLPFVLKGCKWLKDGAGIVEGGIVGM